MVDRTASNGPAADPRMPAEWAPHAACWMGWPCRPEIWDGRMEQARDQFVGVAQAIAQFEPVIMLARPEDFEDARRRCVGIEVRSVPIDDSWLRDSGPCFTIAADGRLAGTAWRFNAWGNKYGGYDNDRALGAAILERTGASPYLSPMVAEGGAFTVDGEGTLITTESCLLNPNRNPGWSRADIEAELRRGLGVTTIVWLPGDVDEHATDGHVDGLAAFVAPGKVLYETHTGPDDPRFDVLEENRRALERARDARGRSFELLAIPEAHDKVVEGDIFCRSFINFYLANGGVVMPRYGTPSDADAVAAVQRAFPDRRIVTVDVTAICYGGGGIHCITQQQPVAAR